MQLPRETERVSDNTANTINVVAISQGRAVPSRRYRILALVPILEKHGVALSELCPRIGSYPPSWRSLRLPWFAAACMERLTLPYRTTGYDAVILQRELISTLATFEKMLPRPLILDVDDAIFMHRNGRAARKISKLSDHLVCGNSWLAERFSQWNTKITVIPTGVDTNQLRPVAETKKEAQPVIGWIGTHGNYRYLRTIEPALRSVLKDCPEARLQIIADEFPEFLKHLGGQLEFRVWYPGVENDLVPGFSIGIMPLTDDEWARGKCSFKMLQYMAAGVPVVASPVGMNAEIFHRDEVGLQAGSLQEWIDALMVLIRESKTAVRLGMNGRRVAEAQYSVNAIGVRWRRVLESVVFGNDG